MELKYKALDHPFYKDWECGKITLEQLSKYAESYKDFIDLMPTFWNKISKAFSIDNEQISKIIMEEAHHIKLWAQWSEKLPEINEYPKLSELIEGFNSLTPSELLGAVHAFEIQQPEVAKTKKAVLINHYGFSGEELIYFDEHEKEEEHIAFGVDLMQNFANKEEFEHGFEIGSKLIYDSLDKFLK